MEWRSSTIIWKSWSKNTMTVRLKRPLRPLSLGMFESRTRTFSFLVRKTHKGDTLPSAKSRATFVIPSLSRKVGGKIFVKYLTNTPSNARSRNKKKNLSSYLPLNCFPWPICQCWLVRKKNYSTYAVFSVYLSVFCLPFNVYVVWKARRLRHNWAKQFFPQST